jgi:hypothetical protein
MRLGPAVDDLSEISGKKPDAAEPHRNGAAPFDPLPFRLSHESCRGGARQQAATLI